MSEAYDKGKAYELHIARLIRKKADKGAMRNRGSHTSSTQDADVYTRLPIHIEAKHHEAVRIKDWVEQAESASNFHETAVVAFRIDDKDYGCLDFNALLDLFIHIDQLQAEVDDLRRPVEAIPVTPNQAIKATTTSVSKDAEALAVKAIEKKQQRQVVKFCHNGHVVDSDGYCLWKGCKYNRTYKPPKKKG